MTLTIEGRTRYADEALSTVYVHSSLLDDPLLIIKGGLIEENNNSRFVIAAMHESATDIEHDSARVAYLEGAGLQYVTMLPRRVRFTGVILKAAFYREVPVVEDMCEAEWCKQEHGFLDYIAPNQKWTPGLYHIEVRFGDDE